MYMPSLSLSQTHSLPLPATKHRRRYRRCRISTFNSLNLLSKQDQLAVDCCRNLKSLPELPPNIKIISRLELKLLAVYEAKKDGLVSTRICGVHPHKQSKGKICFACFESRNCGNYSLVSRIPLGFPRYEIVGGEHIHVYFEIAPSASIVVKMCQLQLFRRTPYRRGFSVDKMKGRKYGFDLAESSCRLANKDEDPKMMIMEDEDQIINNKRDTKYIHLSDNRVADNFLIKIVNTEQVLEDVHGS
ncbi:hypothetical protein LguiB_013754 [Lonicera macranthoides]